MLLDFCIIQSSHHTNKIKFQKMKRNRQNFEITCIVDYYSITFFENFKTLALISEMVIDRAKRQNFQKIVFFYKKMEITKT